MITSEGRDVGVSPATTLHSSLPPPPWGGSGWGFPLMAGPGWGFPYFPSFVAYFTGYSTERKPMINTVMKISATSL